MELYWIYVVATERILSAENKDSYPHYMQITALLLYTKKLVMHISVSCMTCYSSRREKEFRGVHKTVLESWVMALFVTDFHT